MCRLVTGNKSQALREMSQVCSICQRHPRLLNSHRPQLHMLIGLYAMSMNCMDAAEMQFTTSLRVGKKIYKQVNCQQLIVCYIYLHK